MTVLVISAVKLAKYPVMKTVAYKFDSQNIPSLINDVAPVFINEMLSGMPTSVSGSKSYFITTDY